MQVSSACSVNHHSIHGDHSQKVTLSCDLSLSVSTSFVVMHDLQTKIRIQSSTKILRLQIADIVWLSKERYTMRAPMHPCEQSRLCFVEQAPSKSSVIRSLIRETMKKLVDIFCLASILFAFNVSANQNADKSIPPFVQKTNKCTQDSYTATTPHFNSSFWSVSSPISRQARRRQEREVDTRA